jgi:hypothetical protein
MAVQLRRLPPNKKKMPMKNDEFIYVVELNLFENPPGIFLYFKNEPTKETVLTAIKSREWFDDSIEIMNHSIETIKSWDKFPTVGGLWIKKASLMKGNVGAIYVSKEPIHL